LRFRDQKVDVLNRELLNFTKCLGFDIYEDQHHNIVFLCF